MALVLAGVGAPGQARAEALRLGAWADADRTTACVDATAGEAFTWHAFAYVPASRGLAYATFRFRFPSAWRLDGPPRTSDHVSDVIITPFADGTEEWNFVVQGCPAGWVPIFMQDSHLDTGETAVLEVRAGFSLVRDCAFVLENPVVDAVLQVNDPGCDPLPAAAMRWGGLKAVYR